MHYSSIAWAAIGLSTPCFAQVPLFSSPGTPNQPSGGQTDRFDNTFNPAFGLVIDTFADYLDTRGEKSGLDAEVRLVELNASAFVDPNVWAYVTIVAEDETLAVEEAAVEYIGFDSNATVKVGRFFVDFGKQMQMHAEELRTLERPLVLREFLGEELSGTGLQLDYWLPVGDATPLRFSVGVFASLLGEGHGDEDEGLEPESAVPGRKDVDELSISARLTAMTDAGDNGILQGGLSGRFIPEYEAGFETLEQDGLSNSVFGLDLTYGWNNPESNRGFLLGGEYLRFHGDLAVEVDDPLAPTSLIVQSEDVSGFFLYSDYNWSRRDNVGVQYSGIDEPEDPNASRSELDFYYTRQLTELRRLRFGVTMADSDLESDSVRFYVQFTNFFGNHNHGLNW